MRESGIRATIDASRALALGKAARVIISDGLAVCNKTIAGEIKSILKLAEDLFQVT